MLHIIALNSKILPSTGRRVFHSPPRNPGLMELESLLPPLHVPGRAFLSLLQHQRVTSPPVPFFYFTRCLHHKWSGVARCIVSASVPQGDRVQWSHHNTRNGMYLNGGRKRFPFHQGNVDELHVLALQAGAKRAAAPISSACFSDDLTIQNTSSCQDLKL